jgi:hypothetical protein
MHRRDFLNLTSQALLLAAARPLLAQTTMMGTSLASLPDLFVLDKSQWNMTDAAWFERDAVGGGPDLIEMLANVSYIANSINGDPNSRTLGWQNSKIYRADHNGGSPTNARSMEPVYVLALAYTLNKPWNPYYHNQTLKARLEAAVNYWISLQSKAGGFPEDGGAGSESLPPTSFSLEFLVEMREMLDADGTADPRLRARLGKAVEDGANWAVYTEAARNQGFHFSNQYCGTLFTLWRLWEQTGDPRWQHLYNERLDAWLANAQPSLYWMENDGVETFGYGVVTEWELDRIFTRNNDPRLLESFRKYFEWCGLNTLPENDGRTWIMDNVGHGRTLTNQPTGRVGYYNHIASKLPTARPWAYAYVMSDEERQHRMANWLRSPIPPTGTKPGKTAAFHPFHNYPMYFEPHGLWTVTERDFNDSLRQLPTLAQDRFTRYFNVPASQDQFLFARRPGAYVTLHFGRPAGRQAKEIGLVWLPGFGTLLRGFNDKPEFAYRTEVGEKSTYKRPIEDVNIPNNFLAAGADGYVTAGDLDLTTAFRDLGLQKTYRISDGGFGVSLKTDGAAIEQIPLYFDNSDAVEVDGKRLTLGTVALPLQGKTLAVTRTCGGKTAQAMLQFDFRISGSLQRAYNLANGAVYILSVRISENTEISYWLKLA